MNNKDISIKYLTLDAIDEKGNTIETLPQHAFVAHEEFKNVALCNSNIRVKEDGITKNFKDIKPEIIEHSACEDCKEIARKLINRETEIQRFYDASVSVFHETTKKVKELESELRRLKLELIKEQGNIKKAELKAQRMGCFNFL